MSDDDWAEMPAGTAEERVAKALAIAPDGSYDGEHHKTWVIDQMVRALTGCPVVTRTSRFPDAYGRSYEYQGQGESAEYTAFVDAMGDWDEGIAP